MRRLVLFMMAILLVAGTATAQNASSELRGEVVDDQGLALPGVTVVATNQDNGQFRETVANVDGSFFFPVMSPGTYEITAELPGFRRYIRPDVPLTVGSSFNLTVELTVGGIEEEITVTAEAPLVDTTSKEVGGYVQQQELLDTPSFNRNFTGYLDLVPGVVATGSTSSFAADSIMVNGQDSSNVAYNFDGASNDDDHLGGSAGAQARIPIEAVQEFQLLTGQFDAEFGLASGGVLNAVSKSGTNEFHGAMFAFVKGHQMTAKDYFVASQSLVKPDTAEKQLGFTVGGPIIRDKVHFFWSLERPILDTGVTVNIPSRPDQNRAEIEAVRPWNFFLRGDHQINANNTWGGRWLYETSPSTHAASNWGIGTAQHEHDHDWAAGGSINSVIGNNKVNVLRFGEVYEDLHWGSTDESFASPPKAQITQPPQLNYLDWIGGTHNTMFRRINWTLSAENQFSVFVPDKNGDHDLKFGVAWRYMNLNYNSNGRRNGRFIFDTNKDFNASDYSTYPERLSIQVPNNQHYVMTGTVLSGFAQDKWQLNDRTTLSIGFRYDVEIMPTPNADNEFYGAPVSASVYPMDKNNLAPRLGFSHVLDDAGRTVLRGGMGRFYQKFRVTHIDNTFGEQMYDDSFNVNLPLDGVDSGPSNGLRPTAAYLKDGPTVNWAVIDALYPPGSKVLNAGNIRFDNSGRQNPYADQLSFGFERQVADNMALSMDYIRVMQRDQLILFNHNQPERISTARTAKIQRPNSTYVDDVYQLLNGGSIDHDALQVSLDKRFSNNYRFRVSYTLGNTRGNTRQGDAQAVYTQAAGDLNLSANHGPSDFDRRHNLVANTTIAVPGTGGLRVSGIIRVRSGARFSLLDSTLDTNKNGTANDEWLAAGSYSGVGTDSYTVDYAGGRNGGVGPRYFQLDGRAGYTLEMPNADTLEAYVDFINITNNSNFNAPSGDKRRSSTYLILRTLVNNGLPRQLQIGLRYAY